MKMYKMFPLFLLFTLAILHVGINYAPPVCAGESPRWDSLKQKYARAQDVDRLIFVKYKSNSRAKFLMYKKTGENRWQKLISCIAYVGRKGIGKPKDRNAPARSSGSKLWNPSVPAITGRNG